MVPEGVLPAVLSPLVAQEADEGRAPDEVGGGESADQAVEDGEVLGRSVPPRRAQKDIFLSLKYSRETTLCRQDVICSRESRLATVTREVARGRGEKRTDAVD